MSRCVARCLFYAAALALAAHAVTARELPNPILFVTQVPIPGDFTSVGSVFGNHLPAMAETGRGGDLWIRYTDGTLRNLTADAGFGVDGFQNASAIAVRGPCVHFSGAKAVFSMVIGAPEEQYLWQTYFWQLYEITGFGQGETVQITKVPNQPADANNVSPIYLSDGRILFVSDRPRDGSAHLYPQRDEYESAPTTTGLWALDPATGALDLLNHAPSGAFTPILDSFGRVVFTRWDHLQQDQQADADVIDGASNGAFDYADESANAARLALQPEVFPESRGERTDLLAGTPLNGHTINHFFPWQIRQDGTAEEVLNHLGRHEMAGYFDRARHDDPNLQELIPETSGRANQVAIDNFLQLHEDPQTPGRYIGTEAPEFYTHASGQLIAMLAPPSKNPDTITIAALTHPTTRQFVDDGATPPVEHSGHYRDPLILSDGTILAAHTTETRAAHNDGTRSNPIPRYAFRIKQLATDASGYLVASTPLTAGITKTLTYWDPDVLVHYSGELWELDPVEVVARSVPAETPNPLAMPEQAAFDDEGVDVAALRAWLRERNLAMLVVRNATTRDGADRQQPFNLRVPGGATTTGASGTIYDIAHLQLFQGDQVRGYGGVSDPRAGRRVLARPLHDVEAVAANPASGGPTGSVSIELDGSVAAFVPAERALAWQTVAPDGEPIVRERYWITFQPGEIRACDGCHGVNTANQAGNGPSQQSPQALSVLLQRWKSTLVKIFSDTFESGDVSRWSSSRGGPTP